jgi:hypothetical protein
MTVLYCPYFPFFQSSSSFYVGSFVAGLRKLWSTHAVNVQIKMQSQLLRGMHIQLLILLISIVDSSSSSKE